MMRYAYRVAIRVAIWRMTLRHDAVAPKLGSVTDVEQRAVTLARSVKRHKAAYDAALKELKELLPVLRTQGDKPGPKEIEALLEGALDRGTISRETAAAAGTSRKAQAPAGA